VFIAAPFLTSFIVGFVPSFRYQGIEKTENVEFADTGELEERLTVSLQGGGQPHKICITLF
jgi:hypothetical protein